jgi:acetylornithine deacetylase
VGEGSDGLVLAGHTDTVPYDEGAWRSDPFTLTERDGKLYGLGVADMKCFFPLVIEAIRDLDPARLRTSLVIVATADEESTMAGARALLDAGERPGRFVLIGEPTSMQPVRLHKGVLMEALRVLGRSGHASDPRLGNSAIDGMHRVLGALIAWRAELERDYRDPAFEVAVPTLNLGRIEGGDSPNRICAECEVQIDLRILPGMPVDTLRTTLIRKAEEALAGTGLGVERRALFDGVPPLCTDRSSPFVRLIEEICGASAGAVAFATEGPFFNALGMESVVLGPGDIATAHQPDEHLPTERLAPMVALLRRVVAAVCL